MSLINKAIASIKDKETKALQIRHNTFRTLFKNVLDISLLDYSIELDINGYLVYESIKFSLYYEGLTACLKVISVGGKPLPMHLGGLVLSLEDLGKILIKMGVNEVTKCEGCNENIEYGILCLDCRDKRCGLCNGFLFEDGTDRPICQPCPCR